MSGRGGRRRERRQRFSNFLATLVAVADVPADGLEQALVETVPALAPVRRARFIRGGGPAGGEGRGRLVFPVGVADRPGLRLEVDLDPTRGLDGWDRQQLRDAARVIGLCLSARRERSPRGESAPGDPAAPLIGASACMQRLRARIERMASTDFTVLIEGESGSGKELVARQIHELSRRRSGPFVALNCAALVESLLEAELFGIEDRVATGVRGRGGKFEAAHRGTLFLDEVADLSAGAQAKLLRAIQERVVERVGGHRTRDVDLRLVVATNQPLLGLVGSGRFRADLYYRLAGVELDVPALRQRREDVVELVEYFLARHDAMRRMTLSPDASEALKSYDWPGNVRELQRVVERALALAGGDVIDLADLPARVSRDVTEVLQPSLSRADTMRMWGSRYARLVLERCGRNKRRACEVLGISYHTLQSYLRYRPATTGAPLTSGGAAAVRETRLDGTLGGAAGGTVEGAARLDPRRDP